MHSNATINCVGVKMETYIKATISHAKRQGDRYQSGYFEIGQNGYCEDDLNDETYEVSISIYYNGKELFDINEIPQKDIELRQILDILEFPNPPSISDAVYDYIHYSLSDAAAQIKKTVEEYSKYDISVVVNEMIEVKPKPWKRSWTYAGGPWVVVRRKMRKGLKTIIYWDVLDSITGKYKYIGRSFDNAMKEAINRNIKHAAKRSARY